MSLLQKGPFDTLFEQKQLSEGDQETLDAVDMDALLKEKLAQHRALLPKEKVRLSCPPCGGYHDQDD